MKRPILEQIINEVNTLFDALPKGAAWDQARWERERIAIIKRHGYREKSLRRALRLREWEDWYAVNWPE
jgi:hypothetical protein